MVRRPICNSSSRVFLNCGVQEDHHRESQVHGGPEILEPENVCSECGTPFITLTVGGTRWCICTLQSADRDIPRLQAELNLTTERLVAAEEELAKEKDSAEQIRRELHRTAKQVVREDAHAHASDCLRSLLLYRVASRTSSRIWRASFPRIFDSRKKELKANGRDIASWSCDVLRYSNIRHAFQAFLSVSLLTFGAA